MGNSRPAGELQNRSVANRRPVMPSQATPSQRNHNIQKNPSATAGGQQVLNSAPQRRPDGTPIQNRNIQGAPISAQTGATPTLRPNQGQAARPIQPANRPAQPIPSAQRHAQKPPAANQVPSNSEVARKSQSRAVAAPQKVAAQSADAKRAQNRDKQSLMKAKTTEISKIRDEKEKDNYEGEGGNTVISIVKAVVYIIFVIVSSIFISYFAIVVANDVFAFVKSDDAVEVVIPEYATLDNIADILYENDVIKYPSIFKMYAVIRHYDGEFLAGTYTVTPMMNYDMLLEGFKEKKATGTIEITIPEGYTTDEMIDLFVSKGIGTREGFVDVIENYDFDYWFIDELNENGISEDRIYRLDGYLFPDTYQFYLESSEATVINKLLKRFNQIFTKDYRDQCEYLGYTVDEMITLASIIEKEAGTSAEFFKVSSVFHNRLNNKHLYPKLESDATIVYAIQHDTGERTVLKDTNYETPYNTYKYDGLPPGPIANPSASAMLAALTPPETEYFFFISNKGVTYFSKTKAEHDAYIAQFRNEANN